MGRVGGQEDEFDAAIRPFQPVLDHPGMMIAGIVEDDMDPPLIGIGRLQLLEQRDGGSGIDPLGLDQGAVEGL